MLVKDDGARAQPMGLSPPDGRDTMVRAAYGARQGGLVGERGERVNERGARQSALVGDRVGGCGGDCGDHRPRHGDHFISTQ